MGFELRDGAGMNDSSQIIYNVKKDRDKNNPRVFKAMGRRKVPG